MTSFKNEKQSSASLSFYYFLTTIYFFFCNVDLHFPWRAKRVTHILASASWYIEHARCARTSLLVKLCEIPSLDFLQAL